MTTSAASILIPAQARTCNREPIGLTAEDEVRLLDELLFIGISKGTIYMRRSQSSGHLTQVELEITGARPLVRPGGHLEIKLPVLGDEPPLLTTELVKQYIPARYLGYIAGVEDPKLAGKPRLEPDAKDGNVLKWTYTLMYYLPLKRFRSMTLE